MKLTLVFTLFLVLMGAMMTNAKSCVCIAVYDPVCGKNGVTYSNSCVMGCAGVKEAYKGKCGSNI